MNKGLWIQFSRLISKMERLVVICSPIVMPQSVGFHEKGELIITLLTIILLCDS